MTQLRGKLKFLAIAGLMFALASCFSNSDDTDTIDYTPEREAALIQEYLDTMVNRGFDIDTTNAGVYYIKIKEGEGDYVQAGDSIGIEYVGFFVTGVVFDASAYYGDGIYRYVHLGTRMIPGFEDAVSHLKKGGEASFLLPSSMAYGSYGTRTIPPYTPLVFEISLVDIYN